MTQVFDRATPYTLNSTYVVPATKDRLEATVKLKNESAKGLPATKYLLPEVSGGVRNAKRSEIALRRSLNLASGSFIVPGEGVKLALAGSDGSSAESACGIGASGAYHRNIAASIGLKLGDRRHDGGERQPKSWHPSETLALFA